MADCNRQRWGAVCDVVANVLLLLLLLLPLQSWDERKGAMVPIMMIELHQGSSADEARTSLVEFHNFMYHLGPFTTVSAAGLATCCDMQCEGGTVCMPEGLAL